LAFYALSLLAEFWLEVTFSWNSAHIFWHYLTHGRVLSFGSLNPNLKNVFVSSYDLTNQPSIHPFGKNSKQLTKCLHFHLSMIVIKNEKFPTNDFSREINLVSCHSETEICLRTMIAIELGRIMPQQSV